MCRPTSHLLVHSIPVPVTSFLFLRKARHTPIFGLFTWSKLLVSKPLVSLRHTGRRRVVLGYTWNTLWHVITKKSYNVLSTLMILCWATLTAILGGMWPAGRRLDTPDWIPLPRRLFPRYTHGHLQVFISPPSSFCSNVIWCKIASICPYIWVGDS